ncbi:hypothetical protein EJB05_36986, partial [Eragrostis curvula]
MWTTRHWTIMADTRLLFDKMPLSREGKKDKKQHESSGFDELPDGVLEHILGFLPVEEAVRTCVLARRWRHRWKSAAALRILSTGGQFLEPADKLREFMDRLLLARGGAPLDLCELRLGDVDTLLEDEDVFILVDRWFRHAVGCNVQVLRLCARTYPIMHLDDLPLVSQHLTRLELFGVEVPVSLLNFSGCPNLEHLVFESCNLYFGSMMKVLFQSLKHLRITLCALFSDLVSKYRIRISAPNLVSFVLDHFMGSTPILESMPSLREASVKIGDYADFCKLWKTNYWDCNCESCDLYGDTLGGSSSCVILKGLSEAKSLLLISQPGMYNFKRDLRCCPTFSNLKNLWVNDYWCIPDDFRLLACILEHSPILEKLTLQLFSKGPKHKVELEGSISPTERSAANSEYLKTVEVKCSVVDERILNVLRFLHVINICKQNRFSHASMFMVFATNFICRRKSNDEMHILTSLVSGTSRNVLLSHYIGILLKVGRSLRQTWRVKSRPPNCHTAPPPSRGRQADKRKGQDGGADGGENREDCCSGMEFGGRNLLEEVGVVFYLMCKKFWAVVDLLLFLPVKNCRLMLITTVLPHFVHVPYVTWVP